MVIEEPIALMTRAPFRSICVIFSLNRASVRVDDCLGARALPHGTQHGVGIAGPGMVLDQKSA